MADATRDPAVDPVLCDPYGEPDRHWALDERGQARRDVPPVSARRAPLRITVPQDQKSSGQLKLALNDRQVNTSVTDIRRKVGEWRANGYPKVTATTRRLLQHWADAEAMRQRPFFAQREAVETFIWLREVANRGTPERRERGRADTHLVPRQAHDLPGDLDETRRCEIVVERQDLAEAPCAHHLETRRIDEGVLPLVAATQPGPCPGFLLAGHRVQDQLALGLQHGDTIQETDRRAVTVLAAQEGPSLAENQIRREDLLTGADSGEAPQRVEMTGVVGQDPGRPPTRVGELHEP